LRPAPCTASTSSSTARRGEHDLHARACRGLDRLADERVVEDRLLERHGDRLGRLEANGGVALGLVLDERQVQQADDTVPDRQSQIHATSEVSTAEQLSKGLGELVGLRHADVGHSARRELDARRRGDALAIDRYGRRTARVDMQADVSVGFRVEEFPRHWRAT
jgi:hypothetical protein